jgi:hypothetical protein
MNLNSKSTLAKLLARENISVQHGNYRTAFFDVNNRILGLPLWKDKGKDVYDLLVGHEVGHAMHTPAQGWHDAPSENLPKDYLNVVEDIRIEKLIQRQYPGLIASFKRGYKVLCDDDFFQIRGKNVNEMHFMNRLNLKAKLRDMIDITFTDEEMEYVNAAMSVETWEDVVRVSADLHAFMKILQDRAAKQPSLKLPKIKLPKMDSDMATENSDSDEKESPPPTKGESPNAKSNPNNDSAAGKTSAEDQPKETADSSQDQSFDTEDTYKGQDQPATSASGSPSGEMSTQESQDAKAEDSETVGKNKQEVGSIGGDKAGKGLEDIDKIDTDRAYRSNEDRLLDTDEKGRQPLLIRGLNATQLNDILVPFETLKKLRAQRLAIFTDPQNGYVTSRYDVTDSYKEFMSETEKFVGLMAKEFEMRKAAFQYSRSQSARSGSLDVSKLYNYKFSDDIFRRVTKLADAKSHGMIILLDCSGSMNSVMGQVIKQLLTLAMFCKKINIPFDVYGFTSGVYDNVIKYRVGMNDIDHSKMTLTHILSSSFVKKDYDLAFRQLYNQGHEVANYHYASGPSSCDYDELGGTPLNDVLTAMPMIISKFKAHHNLQKVIFTTLTDGDAQHMPVNTDYEMRERTSGLAIQLSDGAIIKANKEREVTQKLVGHIRKMTGVVTIGYFLADSRYNFNGAVGRAAGRWDHSVFAEARKSVAAQKFVSYSNAIGYDKYFVIRVDGRQLDTDTEEFEVTENAKASDIRRAFKKYTISKKQNRVLASQFAEAIS